MGRFAAGGSGLVVSWYALFFSAFLFIPIAVLLHPFLAGENTWYLPLATTFGVLAGAVQMLGFVRWPFLAPSLAASYINPEASDAARERLSAVFLAFNLYAGVGVVVVGERDLFVEKKSKDMKIHAYSTGEVQITLNWRKGQTVFLAAHEWDAARWLEVREAIFSP